MIAILQRKKISNLPKVTELLSGAVRIWVLDTWLQGLVLNQLAHSAQPMKWKELSKLWNTNGQVSNLF